MKSSSEHSKWSDAIPVPEPTVDRPALPLGVGVPIVGTVVVPIVLEVGVPTNDVLGAPMVGISGVPMVGCVGVPIVGAEVPIAGNVGVPMVGESEVPIVGSVGVPIVGESDVPIVGSVEAPVPNVGESGSMPRTTDGWSGGNADALVPANADVIGPKSVSIGKLMDAD